MRGEHLDCGFDDLGDLGSSPHARGTPNIELNDIKFTGIIPACAGNTLDNRFGHGRSWDHPRMRGEHTGLRTRCPRPRGSSPHARGTPSSFMRIAAPTGIIPACAGNTGVVGGRLRRRGDHPRMRGEHVSAASNWRMALGSSPHARGTPKKSMQSHYQPGIIPACAGNTRSCCCRWSHHRDHPRMRGEHYNNSMRTIDTAGSSPHARGTRVRILRQRVNGGIIPACAGNTRIMRA